MSYQQSEDEMQDRSSYDITVHTSPTRRGNSLSPRPLYTASFSASQTALLSRRDSFRSMTSEIPLDRNGGLQGLNVNIVQTCDLDMDHSPRLATHIIGAAISPGLSYSPSHADSISTFASLQNSRQPLSTVDSINWHKHQQGTPPKRISSSSFCSPCLSRRSSPQSGKRSIPGSRFSYSGHSHYVATPESSCLEKFDSLNQAAVYEYNFVSGPEDDDHLHTPDPVKSQGQGDKTGTVFTRRGAMNVGFLFILTVSLLMLFGGYPVLSYVFQAEEDTKGGFNIGGTNASGQVPFIPGLPTLIDRDTPKEVYTKKSVDGSKQLKLVFSDEFNTPGRSFYPGDDPFWEAVNLNYWGTQNYEWYDPAAITTKNGSLIISLTETVDHNLNFRGGMLTSWNKLCFTGGQIEVRAMLPGSPDISGLWPAAWTMGNLGRAGYGATTDGMWPYTYDSCDVGTLANQTYPKSKGGGPIAAETTGVYIDQYGPGLSYLPGQRLSRCTCPGSSNHPGPRHSDGTFVGRSAPEIDIIEAQASNTKGKNGHVSMSLQLAPFDSGYNLTNTAGSYDFYDENAKLNSYTGSVYQQAASGLVQTKNEVYEDSGAQFDTWGFEYKPGGESDSYITWLNSGKPMWKLHTQAMGPDAATEIGQRLVPTEPMYVLLNLGVSSSFTYVNWDDLHFPAKFQIDYVRIWQPEDEENIGCDPPNYPTKDYIEKHWEAYNNPNLTIWTGDRSKGGFGQELPGNSLRSEC